MPACAVRSPGASRLSKLWLSSPPSGPASPCHFEDKIKLGKDGTGGGSGNDEGQGAYSFSSTGLLFVFELKDPRLKSASEAASARGGEGGEVLGHSDEEEAVVAAFFAAVALVWRAGCAWARSRCMVLPG